MKTGIIGLGRVGLPLALVLCDKGHDVTGIEINQDTIDSIQSKKMPFHESKCQELLNNTNLSVSNDMSIVKNFDVIIITVGTPFLPHIEMDLNYLKNAIESFIEFLSKNTLIILRSTVAPNTTMFVKNLIQKHTGFVVGEDVFLSFCPERLAEGFAVDELLSLPQIIGVEDDTSYRLSEKVFGFVECIRTNYISAELIKLFTNIFRYIQFSIPNYFMYIADKYDANVFEIIKLINYNYPRGGVKKPGFVAGTCLRKDFAPISMNEFGVDLGMLSWKINEYTPLFLIKTIKKYTQITNKNILVCGYSFKKDTDDIRDSLSEKFIRLVKNEVPNQISIYDPYIDGYNVLPNDVKNYDIVFITTNHTQFTNEFFKALLLKDDSYIVDVWNTCKLDRLIFRGGNLK